MTNLLRGEGGSKVSAIAVGTSAGCSATFAAVVSQKLIVSNISGSGDAAALVTLESPTGTPIWRKRFAGAFAFSENFEFGEFEGAMNTAVTLKISASTANCEANLAGVLVAQ